MSFLCIFFSDVENTGLLKSQPKKNRKKKQGSLFTNDFCMFVLFSAHFIVYSWFYIQLKRFWCWMLDVVVFWGGWGGWMVWTIHLHESSGFLIRSVEAHIDLESPGPIGDSCQQIISRCFLDTPDRDEMLLWKEILVHIAKSNLNRIMTVCTSYICECISLYW